MDKEQAVIKRYAEAARRFEESLCCPTGYNPEYLKVIPEEILQKDYGCGDPSIYVKEGECVLDLGSGGGKLCYLIAQVVGPAGRVIGVDMNDEMLSLARKYRKEIGEKLGYQNVEFRKAKIQNLRLNIEKVDGYLKSNPIALSSELAQFDAFIEHLQRNEPLIADSSVDVVVSNCALNLVRPEDKGQLFREIYRVLKNGGRAVISDIVSDEDVPEYMQNDTELWSGCISGALREDLFLQSFEDAGFYGMQILKWDSTPWRTVDGIKFRSVTVAAFKGKEGDNIIYRHPKETKGADFFITTGASECCPGGQCDYHEPFEQRLKRLGKELKKDNITTIQINIGNLCNQSCTHCHVDASPRGTRIMSWEVMKGIIHFLKNNPGLNLDITGGAPELHPNIEGFISECSFHVNFIALRSNLTAMLQKQGIIKILKNHRVELICSLPDTSLHKTNYQRGHGVFEESIRALKVLNDAGYGHELALHLVHNPTGFVLPEVQDMIEERYRDYLKEEHGIVFNKLFILTNMPIGRFRKMLDRHGSHSRYTSMLSSGFNPITLDGLMCRYILNIGWDGKLYDCDFNNALGLSANPPHPLKLETLIGNDIAVGDHCYGCTAMKGSGCYGNIVKQ